MLFEKLVQHGNWLFRWRSFLPLALAPIAVAAMLKFSYPFGSPLLDDLWEVVCAAVTIFGIFIRAYTIGYAPKGTSGGNTKQQNAVTLNVTGSYSVVRHPLYVGNFFMWLGVAMFTQSLTVVAVFSLVFWIYYERIMMAEEAYLAKRFPDKFKEWASKTPAFMPNPALWQPPQTQYAWRTVIRREYSPVFAVIAIFSLLELIGDIAAFGTLTFEPAWVAIFLCGAGAYLGIMYLKRRTHLLDERR